MNSWLRAWRVAKEVALRPVETNEKKSVDVDHDDSPGGVGAGGGLPKNQKSQGPTRPPLEPTGRIV